jgi:hypothetical protein
VPLLDQLARKMTAAFRKASTDEGRWCGFHECVCGALSTDRDYNLPNGAMTNSLCVHYVAYHRSEIPSDQLARIEAFPFGENEPNDAELQGPEFVRARVRRSIEAKLEPEPLSTWITWGLDFEDLALALCVEPRSERRFEAHCLLWLLSSIELNSLPRVKLVVEQNHGDVRTWGERALRIPGWSRELWVSPLLDRIQQCTGMARRTAASLLGTLGASGAGAVPVLLELAKSKTDDGDYQYDLSLALNDLSRALGASSAIRPVSRTSHPPI